MIKIRQYKPNEGRAKRWQCDIRVRLPCGNIYRERILAPGSNKSGAKRWADRRIDHLIKFGHDRNPGTSSTASDRDETVECPTVPTLEEFRSRYMREYAEANKEKPSSIASKESIIRVHLVPHFGSTRLDKFTTIDVQKLKLKLKSRRPKTINNILTVLSSLLKTAVEWRVIEKMPIRIQLVKVPEKKVSFYSRQEYTALVACAENIDPRIHIMVLLGGEAGLRLGESIGLRWEDVCFNDKMLTVQRSVWRGHVGSTKGNRIRRVPMTKRLVNALLEFQGTAIGPMVFYRDCGKPVNSRWVIYRLNKAQSAANLPRKGIHILRHSMISALAMKSAPVRVIQELAGHVDIGTTIGYMHVSDQSRSDVIKLLDD